VFRRNSTSNGAKWRSIPPELGPWWLAAQLFIRWAKQGVWKRLLEWAQERMGDVALGMVFLDGTSIRSHQKAGGAQKGVNSLERDRREALGRSRGGYGTKACVIADSRGRAVAFTLAPGRPTSCRSPPACLAACRMGLAGWWATAAMLPIGFAT